MSAKYPERLDNDRRLTYRAAMSTPHNPHDLFFKYTWSQLSVARGFFQRYLPADVLAELDLTRLSLSKDSFIEPDLRTQYSDLLYRTHTQTGHDCALYVLLEHKSYVSDWVGLQVLDYLVRIWQQERTQRKKPPLPAIIPLVLYHGEKSWTAATTFSELIDCPKALLRYLPKFHYTLCDLTQDQLEHLHDQALLAIGLQVLKYGRSGELPDRLLGILKLFRQLLEPNDSALAYLEIVLRYLAQVSGTLTETHLQEALQQALPTDLGAQLMPTLAETWHEQGLKQGLEQGLETHARNTLSRLLIQRFGSLPETIEQRIEQAPQAQLDAWLDQVIAASSLQSIFGMDAIQ